MTETAIHLRRVVKRFGHRTALDRIDLDLPRGRILALVGPNGSGKTTLLKLLAGLLRPTAGEVRVFGLDPRTDRAAVMAHARFAFAPPALYPNLTARETLVALADMSAPRGRESRDHRVDAALQTVGLADRADDPIRVYSFGMRQRLALAQALVPMPRLLVLDEPTDGLDPVAVIDLRQNLRRLRDEHDVTILLSSHLIVEVEKLVDDVLLLHEGRSLFLGRPSDLLADVGRADRFVGRTLLRVAGDGQPAARAADVLRRHGFQPSIVASDAVELDAGALALRDAVDLFAHDGITLSAFHPPTPTLEDALIARLRNSAARALAAPPASHSDDQAAEDR